MEPQAIKAILREFKVCRSTLHATPLANELKPLIENVKFKLPSSVKEEYQNQPLKLERSSPELKLRLQYLKEFSAQPNASEKSKNVNIFCKDFQTFLDGRSNLLIADNILEDAYKIIQDSERNEEDDFVHKARIEGVVLRTSPSYVSLITLDGSEELLVKVNREFVGLGIKVRAGDVISVVNPKLTQSKTSDLDPELKCCYDMSKDEVDIFFKNVKQPTDNPLGIHGKFERSLAVWQHIINVSIMKEEEDKEHHGEISKNILEICKIFGGFQAQTQMTTIMIRFWDALEDSRFFNKALPEIIKDEAWQRNNINLLENVLENLFKAHPECAVRAIGILKSLTCIPVESGVEFNRKLFSMIAPFVTGVSEKPKNPESSCCYDISEVEVDNFIKNVKQLKDNPFGILGKFERSLAVWQHIINVSIMKEENDKEPDGEVSKNILEICKIFSDYQAKTQMTTIMIHFWDALENSRFFNKALPEIIKDEAWQTADNINLVENLLENLLKVHPECAVRAIGILESLTCIPVKSGVKFIQKLFSIIAPFVTGVSKKPKHLKWNQKSVIPLPTELEHGPDFDFRGLQPVRVKKDEDEDEEKKQKKGNKKKNEIAYKSEEEYIETYYALLRVECFHKVKKGIHSFLAKKKCDPKDNMLYCIKLIEISDHNELPIHEGLSLVLECHHNNETNKSDLDAYQDNSKWLMLGNLVCLLLDATLENPVWGVISKKRTAEDSKQKHVHVSLCTKNNRLRDSEVITELQELKSQGLLAYMIESDTFYPAFGPILEVLKNKVTVPFAEQLVKVKKSPLASRRQSPDHSVAGHDKCHFQWMFAKLLAKHKMESYCCQEDKVCHCQLQNSGPNYLRHITKPPKWDVIFENPSSSDCSVSSGFYDVVREFKKMREDPESKPKLDDKQLDAVEQALFNKVALIQGPPGTGKSFVGKALLHLLLSMEVPKHGPILIATYKNYSLDEFLESFLDKNPEFKNDVVRVRRSKEGTSELLQQYNLSQLTSGSMEKQMYQNLKKLDTELYLIKKEIYQCFSELENSNHFTASVFLKEANEKHLKSLLKDKKERIEGMMKDENFLDKYQKELLEMIKEPLKTWMPSEKEFESFARNAGIPEAVQSNTEGLPTDANSNNQLNDSGSTIDSEKTNEDDDSSGLETQPSDDLEERQGALLDQQQDSTQLGEEIAQPVVPISACEEEVLVTLPVIPDEKLGDFKSILNAGDIEELTLEEKIQFVYALQRQNRTTLRKRFLQLNKQLSQKQQIRKEIRYQHSVNILKKRKVIFMTVNGAAIRASWLESIKPSVIIVEEAAEILESQLVAVIPSSVQHLVMIGDHKQLRPQVHYDVLCRKFYFHISMFERLIKGGLDYVQLNQQGRMSDDLAQLVRELGIYKEYKTRDEVVRANCLPNCLTVPMYFFHHDHQVKTHPSSHSKYNIKEAHQIIRMAKFLLKNGVPPEKVTILCSYRGQVNEFNNIRKQPNVGCGLTAIKVTTIDSFQGKENDIILLSLVCNISKSNSEAKIGYLSCKNRLCVAISRARCGLYLFGNADLLSKNSKKYWKKIIELMRKEKCLGNELSFLNLEQSPCIKKTSIGEAPKTATLITDLKILLDPEVSLKDSFALLAEQFGLKKKEIDYLRSTGKPTEKLLDHISGRTIGELQDKINSIERIDVADKVKDYILKNCKCFECTTT